MQDILIQFILPILTAGIAYFGAVYKSKTELEAVKEQQRTEIEKIEKQAKADIEKLEKEMKSQAKLYENNAQTDMIKGVMEKAITPNLEKKISQYINKEFDNQFGDE